MVAVSSVDGRITKWDEDYIYKWTSRQDYGYFENLKKDYDLIVMGSGTYNVVLPKPEKERLRIVLTKTPSKYKKLWISKQLEFSREAPLELIKRLEKLGYKKMLLVGGSKINTLFLKKKLVNQLWLTLEPKIFGEGKSMANDKLNLSLKLNSIERLNANGTLLLKYLIDNR